MSSINPHTCVNQDVIYVNVNVHIIELNIALVWLLYHKYKWVKNFTNSELNITPAQPLYHKYKWINYYTSFDHYIINEWIKYCIS